MTMSPNFSQQWPLMIVLDSIVEVVNVIVKSIIDCVLTASYMLPISSVRGS